MMRSYETAGCAGKVTFQTFTQARKSAARSRFSKDAHLAAYHCTACGLYHVGNSYAHQKSVAIKRRRQRQHLTTEQDYAI